MNRDNNDLANKSIKLIEYESNNVFKIYNKVINKEYGRWVEIYNKLKEFSQEIKKPINIIVKKPFLGFHSQGMRIIENDKISIKIWGINPPHLVHELVHCYFPSKIKSFHEGFADYIQNLYYNPNNFKEKEKYQKYKKFKINRINKILKQLFLVKNIDNASNLYSIWSNYEYYNDTRYANMFISRILSMLFVNFLIEKYTLKDYFNDFHYIENEKNICHNLSNLFLEFYNLNFNFKIKPGIKIFCINKKYQFYSQKWKIFNKYNLPLIGNPLAYLKNTEINISENKKALKIYKIELKLFNKILKISKLDKFIWLRKLIN